jgi:hypothetical protein
MANIINTGVSRSLAYYPAAGTDIDDAGGNLTWNPATNTVNITGRLILQKNTNGSDNSFVGITAGTNTSPFFFFRTRGTVAAPTKVQTGDVLTALNFGGRTDIGYISGAYIHAVVNGTVSNTSMPADLLFGTDNGSGQAYRAKLAKDGRLNVNSISNFSGNDLTLTAAGKVVLGDPSKINISGGTSGQVLSTDGAGGLSWITPAGGSGGSLPSRVTKVASVTLAAGADGNIDLTAFKGYVLYKIQTSAPAWVRIYTSSTARTADVNRSQSTDPLPSAGVLAEVITTTNNEITTFSPGVHCYNDDDTVGTKSYLRVRNLTTSSATISVTLTLLQTEA